MYMHLNTILASALFNKGSLITGAHRADMESPVVKHFKLLFLSIVKVCLNRVEVSQIVFCIFYFEGCKDCKSVVLNLFLGAPCTCI